jgi:hypothetical protein
MSKSKKQKRKEYGIYFLVGTIAIFGLSFLTFAIGYKGNLQNVFFCLLPICLIIGLGFLVASYRTKEEENESN